MKLTRWETAQYICILCGDNGFRKLFGTDIHNFGLASVMCERCGLITLLPRLTESATRTFYLAEYRRLYLDDPKLLNDEYIRCRGYYQAAEHRAHHYAAYFGAASEVVEVGSGTGIFLHRIMKLHGARVLGIEPDGRFASYGQRRFGVDTIVDTFESCTLEPDTFTHAAVFHTLEHTRDPFAFLAKVNRLLRPNGFVFVEVPNILGNWHGLGMIHIAHTFYFSLNTIRMLLTKAGFQIVALEAWEHAPFRASLTAVGQKRTESIPAPFALDPPDDYNLVSRHFADRLENWRIDQVRNWLARLAAGWVGTDGLDMLKRKLGGSG